MTTEPARLGDVLELVRDPVDIDVTEKYQKIGVRSFGKGIFHYEPMPGSELGKLRFYEVRSGELVLSNIKAWEGAIAISSDEDAGLVASNRFLTYRPRPPARVDVRFIRYLLLSDVGMAHIRGASPGSADRNRTLGIKAFEAIELPLPRISEQEHLADQLEAVEARVSRVKDHLQTANDLYLKGLNAVVHRADLDESEKGRRGWRRRSVGEFLSLDMDEVQLRDEELYPMAGVYSFGRGLFAKDPVSGHDTSYTKCYRLHEDQIVLSRLFGWEGALALVTDEFDGRFVSTEFPTFWVDPEMAIAQFAAALFATETFWSGLRSEAEGMGVRRQRIYPEQFLGQEVWLPPTSYQRSITPHLARLREIANDERREELLEATLPSLLNATFIESA